MICRCLSSHLFWHQAKKSSQAPAGYRQQSCLRPRVWRSPGEFLPGSSLYQCLYSYGRSPRETSICRATLVVLPTNLLNDGRGSFSPTGKVHAQPVSIPFEWLLLELRIRRMPYGHRGGCRNSSTGQWTYLSRPYA